MKVSGLQQFIRELGVMLQDAEAKKAAGELSFIADRLEPFREASLREFGKVLEKAANPTEGGSTQSKQPAGSIREAVVADVLTQLRAVHAQVLKGEATRVVVTDKVGEIRSTSKIKKAELEKVMVELGMTKKRGNLKEMEEAIVEKLLQDKEDLARAGV